MDKDARLVTLEERLRQANETISALRCEVGALKAEKVGDEQAWRYWYQAKAERQGKALKRLNQRVVNQRFVLSKVNQLGRGLTKEEWLQYKVEKDYVTEDDSLLVG